MRSKQMSETTDSRRPEETPESEEFPITPSARPPVSIPPETLKGFLAVSESLQRYMEQNNRIFEQVIKASAVHASIFEKINLSTSLEVSRILDAQIRSFELSRVLQSPVLELANTVNLSIGRLFEAADTIRVNELLKQVVLPSSIWEEQLQAIEKVAGELRRYDLALQSHLAEISKFSILSQAAVSRLAWENIGNALDLQASIRGVLQDRFLDFTRSYSKLFDFWEKQPSFVISLPPVVSKFPAIEFFNGVDVVDSITIRPYEDIEFQEEKQRAEEQVWEETEDRLEALLIRLNTGLIVPLRGARQSLDSANPDHVRHFAVSLRELFTHVLHALSPDDKIRTWSTAPEHYDKGKPTRRARLLYICRILNQEPFSTFLEKDIEAGLEFLKLFQRGTHEVVPKYTDIQLRIMLVRMESLLRFLLEIWSID
jgi:hypothetical protein